MTHAPISLLLHHVAELAATFRDGLEEASHAPTKSYAACLASYAEDVPEHGKDATQIIQEMAAHAEGGLIMPSAPRFFGWVMGSSLPIGVAADALAKSWGQLGAHPSYTPAAAAAETVAERWLLDLLNLPRESSIGFTSGATLANFTCLAAARGEVLRRVGWDVDRDGLFGAPPITVLIGDDAHSTVFMGLQYLGLGHDRVQRIATDAQGRIVASAFAETVAKVSGPCIVILQAGQINTGDFDHFAELVPLAHAAGAWVHVDGAFGLWARISPHFAAKTHAIETADSWAVDGHKWLQTPYDCGFAIVKHELAHRRAMSIEASYLPTAPEGERVPFFYIPELSKAARGFAVWAIIKFLGRSGIKEMVERHCRVAQGMAATLAKEPGVTVLNDVVLNQAIVRWGSDLETKAGDELTKACITQIQREGECFAAGASWRGMQVMRISVVNVATDQAQGQRAVTAMLRAYRQCRADLNRPVQTT